MLLSAVVGIGYLFMCGSFSMSVQPLQIVSLDDRFTLQVADRPHTQSNELLAYNGTIPGPILRAVQDSTVEIEVTNNLSHPTTIHWHGLRVDRASDGTPTTHDHTEHDAVQDPAIIASHASKTVSLTFPDVGFFWYHPHLREDRDQDRGLYGGILVVPKDEPERFFPEGSQILFLDDIELSWRGKPIFADLPTHSLMGRYGTQPLINGQARYQGTTVLPTGPTRFFLVNAANARPWRLSVPGATLTLIGEDAGFLETPRVVEEVVLGPSERVVIDIAFPKSGLYTVVHRGDEVWNLAEFQVDEHVVSHHVVAPSSPISDEVKRLSGASLNEWRQQAPDRVWEFDLDWQRGGGHAGHTMDHAMHTGADGIEWSDQMGKMNSESTPQTVAWHMKDAATGAFDEMIQTQVAQGSWSTLRLLNRADSAHPMQHPFHLHGQRFVVLAVDGAVPETLGWQDTVLIPAGATVDLLVEWANPGRWMAHCHIAEHLEAGMFTWIDVVPNVL